MKSNVTRRRILRAAAGFGALGVGFGTASGRTASPEDFDRFVVCVESSAALEATTDRAEEVHRVLDFRDLGKMVVCTLPDSSCASLAARSDVRYVEPDRFASASGHGSGAQIVPWGVDRVDADVAHHEGFLGRGAHVAVVDTGIDSDHPDLRANLGEGRAFVECGSTSAGEPCSSTAGDACHQPWDDDNGHGTHAAGIVAAANDEHGVVGVAPEATLHAVKALDCRGSGRHSAIAAGIKYATDQGWDVVLLSLGSNASTQVMHDAVKYAYRRGVLLVAAAGNNGPCTDCVNFPAAYPEVVAVSATTQTDELASFSSTGPQIELAAPGSRVPSTVPSGYGLSSGTSIACPHVAGVAALLAARDVPHATRVEFDATDQLTVASYEDPGGVRGRLRETAESLGLPPNEQGYGLVDAQAALADDGGRVPTVIGERGRASTAQPSADSWRSLAFQRTYADPVALTGPVSYAGRHPCHVRLQNVSATGLDYQLEEWASLDGRHATESLSYAVLKAGTYRASPALRLEAGTVTTTHRFSRATFSQAFSTTPVVLTQAQTEDGRDPVATRQRNVSPTGVDVRLQEEETLGPHTNETVGYVAVEPGAGSVNDTRFEAGRTLDAVTHNWHRISFDRTYDAPVFLADLQTFDGSDTAALRYRNLTGSGVEVFVEEERSGDAETSHTDEVVGYLVFEGAGLV